MGMSLTKDDLRAVRAAVDESINERMPVMIDVYIKPMFTELESRISGAFDETQTQINDLKTDVDGMKTDLSDIKKDVKDIKITVRHLELRGTLKA